MGAIVTIWHINGRYFREQNNITEEITVDEYTKYFNSQELNIKLDNMFHVKHYKYKTKKGGNQYG